MTRKRVSKGVPNRDGSGGGDRVNKGKGGCKKPRKYGKQRRNQK